MMRSVPSLKRWLSTAICLLMSFGLLYSAAAQVGGPYEPDTATMLLLHYDDIIDKASEISDDAVGHANLSFVSIAALGLVQVLLLDNDSQGDSSYVTVPHGDALNLDGNWTIEG